MKGYCEKGHFIGRSIECHECKTKKDKAVRDKIWRINNPEKYKEKLQKNNECKKALHVDINVENCKITIAAASYIWKPDK